MRRCRERKDVYLAGPHQKHVLIKRRLLYRCAISLYGLSVFFSEVPQVHIEAITKEKALNVLKKIQELPDEDRNETKPDQNRRILQKAADKDSRYLIRSSVSNNLQPT